MNKCINLIQMSAWSYHKRGEGGRPGLRMIDRYIHKHIQDWECFFLLHSLQSEIEQTQETKSKSKLTQMNVSPNQSSPMISINPRCNPQNISKWIMQNNSIRFYQNKIWKKKKKKWNEREVKFLELLETKINKFRGERLELVSSPREQ